MFLNIVKLKISNLGLNILTCLLNTAVRPKCQSLTECVDENLISKAIGQINVQHSFIDSNAMLVIQYLAL